MRARRRRRWPAPGDGGPEHELRFKTRWGRPRVLARRAAARRAGRHAGAARHLRIDRQWGGRRSGPPSATSPAPRQAHRPGRRPRRPRIRRFRRQGSPWTSRRRAAFVPPPRPARGEPGTRVVATHPSHLHELWQRGNAGRTPQPAWRVVARGGVRRRGAARLTRCSTPPPTASAGCCSPRRAAPAPGPPGRPGIRLGSAGSSRPLLDQAPRT